MAAATRTWAEAAARLARRALDHPGHAGQWHCEGTWFVGVDALDNAPDGSLHGVALAGPAIDAVVARHGDQDWHKAQVSVVRQGYPRPRTGESAAAFRYRRDRDAAHVDGVLPVGPDRRRFVREPHDFILGLPLNDCRAEAAPLVVWEGSHTIMMQAFQNAFGGRSEHACRDTDVTGIYQAARKTVFDTCPRVALHGPPGSAVMLHRHLLHGVAPWPADVPGPQDGRMIAYFRPQLGSVRAWAGLAGDT